VLARCLLGCLLGWHAGIGHPSLSSIKGTNLGLHLGHLGAPLHTHGVRSRVWQRPLSSLLTHTTTRQASLQLHLHKSAAAAAQHLATAAAWLEQQHVNASPNCITVLPCVLLDGRSGPNALPTDITARCCSAATYVASVMLLNSALHPPHPLLLYCCCSVYLQQHGPLLSRVSGLSSVTSASELSAAIAAAPSAAALQSLAAAAASAPHQAWMVQQYKVGAEAVLPSK
jgi:hypothetical protein